MVSALHIRESPPQFENRNMARVYIRSITRSTMYQKLYFVSRNWRMENEFCSMWVQLYLNRNKQNNIDII